MKYRTLLLFGAPGSGKGTQGKVLGMLPGFFHCACGDVFRSLKPETPLGQIFVQYSSRGQLVPDDFTVRLWRDFIESSTQAGRFQPEHHVLLLDGIPRNLPQAEILRDTLDVQAMFLLDCRNPENLIHRLQRRALKENRLDDANLDVIRDRLKTYEAETKPLVKFYGKARVHRVNADQTPMKVCLDILKRIHRLGLQPGG